MTKIGINLTKGTLQEPGDEQKKHTPQTPTEPIVEAIADALLILDTTEKFLANHKDLLSEDEMREATGQIAKLRQTMGIQDEAALRQETEKLNELSQGFAQRTLQ